MTPSARELELAERLEKAEEIIDTLRNSQVDAVVGSDKTRVRRLQQIEDQLSNQASIASNRLKEIESIYQNVPVGLCVLDRELRFVRLNQYLAEINGLPIEEHLGRTVRELLPDLANMVEQELRHVLETGEAKMNVLLKGETPAQPGVIRHWQEHWLPLKDEQEKIIGINMVVEEVTERRRFEEELQELNATLERRVAERTLIAEQRAERLRELAMEMTRVEEKERRRLAEVLHDGLQQILVAAKFQAAVVRSRLVNQDDLDQPIQNIERFLDQAMEASRSLSYDLSPPILRNRGLDAAFAWLAREMKRKHGLSVDFRSEGEIPEISDSFKAFLFQGARELLFNVIKHSGVDQAAICLRGDGREIHLEVRDQGCGFSIEEIDLRESSGWGLTGFREKLNLMNGSLTIESEPGLGTCVRARVAGDIDVSSSRLAEANLQAQLETDPSGPELMQDSFIGMLSTTISVLVVDDHQVVRSGLVYLLDNEPDIEIIGEAGNGKEAVAAVRKRQPDVIVMDMSMPVMDGVEATRVIHQEFPAIRIIGLSVYDEGEFLEAMREAGAKMLLGKSGPSELLLAAVRGQEASSLAPT